MQLSDSRKRPRSPDAVRDTLSPLVLRRDLLAQFCGAHFFGKLVAERFVRVSVGPSQCQLLLVLKAEMGASPYHVTFGVRDSSVACTATTGIRLRCWNFITNAEVTVRISDISNTAPLASEADDVLTAVDQSLAESSHKSAARKQPQLSAPARREVLTDQLARILADARRGAGCAINRRCCYPPSTSSESAGVSRDLWGCGPLAPSRIAPWDTRCRDGAIPVAVPLHHRCIVVLRSWIAQDAGPDSLASFASFSADASATLPTSTTSSRFEGGTAAADDNKTVGEAAAAAAATAAASDAGLSPFSGELGGLVAALPDAWAPSLTGSDATCTSDNDNPAVLSRGINSRGLGLGFARRLERVVGEFSYLLLCRAPASLSISSPCGAQSSGGSVSSSKVETPAGQNLVMAAGGIPIPCSNSAASVISARPRSSGGGVYLDAPAVNADQNYDEYQPVLTALRVVRSYFDSAVTLEQLSACVLQQIDFCGCCSDGDATSGVSSAGDGATADVSPSRHPLRPLLGPCQLFVVDADALAVLAVAEATSQASVSASAASASSASTRAPSSRASNAAGAVSDAPAFPPFIAPAVGAWIRRLTERNSRVLEMMKSTGDACAAAAAAAATADAPLPLGAQRPHTASPAPARAPSLHGYWDGSADGSYVRTSCVDCSGSSSGGANSAALQRGDAVDTTTSATASTAASSLAMLPPAAAAAAATAAATNITAAVEVPLTPGGAVWVRESALARAVAGGRGPPLSPSLHALLHLVCGSAQRTGDISSDISKSSSSSGLATPIDSHTAPAAAAQTATYSATVAADAASAAALAFSGDADPEDPVRVTEALLAASAVSERFAGTTAQCNALAAPAPHAAKAVAADVAPLRWQLLHVSRRGLESAAAAAATATAPTGKHVGSSALHNMSSSSTAAARSQPQPLTPLDFTFSSWSPFLFPARHRDARHVAVLFHGTSRAQGESIAIAGFRRPMCRLLARCLSGSCDCQMEGFGVYLSQRDKATEYALRRGAADPSHVGALVAVAVDLGYCKVAGPAPCPCGCGKRYADHGGTWYAREGHDTLFVRGTSGNGEATRVHEWAVADPARCRVIGVQEVKIRG